MKRRKGRDIWIIFSFYMSSVFLLPIPKPKGNAGYARSAITVTCVPFGLDWYWNKAHRPHTPPLIR